MQSLVHIADGHALLQYFVAIHVGIDLGDCGIELRSDAHELGPFARRLKKFLQVLIEKLHGAAAAVLKVHREPSGIA